MEAKSAAHTEMEHTSIEHVSSPSGDREAKVSPEIVSEVATHYNDFMVKNGPLF